LLFDRIQCLIIHHTLFYSFHINCRMIKTQEIESKMADLAEMASRVRELLQTRDESRPQNGHLRPFCGRRRPPLGLASVLRGGQGWSKVVAAGGRCRKSRKLTLNVQSGQPELQWGRAVWLSILGVSLTKIHSLSPVNSVRNFLSSPPFPNLLIFHFIPLSNSNLNWMARIRSFYSI